MNIPYRFLIPIAGLLTGISLQAAPKVVLISLDGATPRLVEQYLASGALPTTAGLGLLQNKGVRAVVNQTASPSLTAVGHIAIATGSIAAHNNIVANSFHLAASPFHSNISGFGAPIGGYCRECAGGGPGPNPSPTAAPIWVHLLAAGRKVITATWPGADGVDVRVPGATTGTVVQGAALRTATYTVPFGASAGVGARGFSLTAAEFGPATEAIVMQLSAAGHPSFSPVLQKSTPLESLTIGGVTSSIGMAVLDTSDDATRNYDTLAFFDVARGIEVGPFALPATGPAYVRAADKRSSPFYIEGSWNRSGFHYQATHLAPDLSVVRLSRTSANAIPRNTAVLGDVDDINTNVGFWAPQPDFRIPERISPGYGPFPDAELEEIYSDLVRGFTDYQTRIALRAMNQVPDADLAMIYFEQPDGSTHQFLLTDPRQPTDFTNPASIGSGQNAAKVSRYAGYVRLAYQTANTAVQRIIDHVGVDASGRPKSNVIVVSDHGFEAFHTAVNMTALLTSTGIPAARVRAVTSGPAVNFYINLAGRDRAGTVSRAEYPALRRQIVDLVTQLTDTNQTYTLGVAKVPVFDKTYLRPIPADVNDPSFGLGTDEFIGQDSGDVYALLRVGYNFDGTQNPVVIRSGDAPGATPVLSVPNFHGAHGYDPTLVNMSAVLYAAGPDISSGVVPVARNIDVAPTIAEILGVRLWSIDGRVLPLGLPRLAGALVTGLPAGFRVRFEALPGQIFSLEASGDLKAWSPIHTGPVAGNFFEYVDAAGGLHRFYRARQDRRVLPQAAGP